MSGMPWVKLYSEFLDDPKLARLDDQVKLRFVQLLLLAGECDAEGYLVSGTYKMTLDDLAWRLRIPFEVCEHDIHELQEHGMVTYDEALGAFLVVKFADRQGRSQEEKRAEWRERQDRFRDKQPEPEPVTTAGTGVTRDKPVTNAPRVEKSREEKRRGRAEGEGILPAENSLAEARSVYPDNFDFATLMPGQYDHIPELKIFKRVTKRTPGSLQLEEIVKTIRQYKFAERDLVEPWRQWAVLHAYKAESLVWLTEWAPAAQRGEKPWEHKAAIKTGGNGSSPQSLTDAAREHQAQQRARGEL